MSQKISQTDVDNLKLFCKSVREDVIKMIHNAKSGHPGGCLSAVDIISTLYNTCLKHYPAWNNSPDFEKRDRFILSKGHASATLYSVLARCGYFNVDELMTFRKFPTRLQGHPSCQHLEGIEVSTGSLGQGLSIGCGVALGLKLDKNPAKVVVYTGDGELQEGNIWEGVMNAAHHRLDNIIVIVDRNKLQIDSSTENIKKIGDLKAKFEAFEWKVLEIDGHDIEQIYNAYQEAKNAGCPCAIIANTVKGKGISFMENNVGWHGKAPNNDDFEKAMEELRGKVC